MNNEGARADVWKSLAEMGVGHSEKGDGGNS
jgi:hypothetical protein